MALLQEKQVFLCGPGGPVETPDRLTFRSYREVGEHAFVEAIRRVTEGTRDREIQALGGPQAAAVLLEIMHVIYFFNLTALGLFVMISREKLSNHIIDPKNHQNQEANG